MYFHGPNSVTHYASSDNLRTWTFGGTILHAKDFSPIGEEASYAKVTEHEVPGLGNKYVLLLMNQESQVRRIYWAHSKDGINWTPVPKPLISPDLNYKKIPGTDIKPNYSADPNANAPNSPASMGKNNVAGSFLMEKDGRYFVYCNGSSGHLFIIEVGESLDMEIHWGEYMKASDVVIDTDDNGNPFPAPRVAAPMFIQDDNSKWYMFFEVGGRVGANIAYAKEEDLNSLVSPSIKGISIYPSMVKKGGKLTVNVENAEELSVEIRDLSGKIISRRKIDGSSGDIQAPAAPGLYFVKINQAGVSKIIVQ
jgi:hypothetical protein